jgi:O-antigen/teichoic acid export membrane protein
MAAPTDEADSTLAVAEDRARATGLLIDNVASLLLRQIAIWGTSFVIVLFVPRYLGDEGFGQITFATAVLMVLMIVTSLGSEELAVKRIAVRPADAAQILWRTYVVRLITSLAAAGAIVMALQVMPGVNGELRDVLYVTAATLVVMSLNGAQRAAIRGLQKMRWLSLAEVANKLTVMVLAIAVLTAGYGVTAYAAALLAGAAVSLLINGWQLGHMHAARPRFERRELNSLLIDSLPFFFIGSISQVYAWVDVGMLMVMTSEAVVGWYGAALQLFNTINVIPFLLATAFLPALARLHSDPRELTRLGRTALGIVLITGVPLAFGLVVLSGSVIDFLGYPAEFESSVPLLTILAITIPITGVLIVMATIIAAADRQSAWVGVLVAALVLDVVLNLPLILYFEDSAGNGAIGAALAAVFAETSQIAFGLRLLPQGMVNRDLLRLFAKVSLASVAMAAVMLLTAGAPGVAATVVCAGCLTYGLLLLALKAVEPSTLGATLDAWRRREDGRTPPRPAQGQGVTVHSEGGLT